MGNTLTNEEKKVLNEIGKDIFEITFGQYDLSHMDTFVELIKENTNES